MNARMRMILKGWGSVFALAFGLFSPSSAAADAIRFSTSGHFDLASGTVDLDGVSEAGPGAKDFPIGAIPVEGMAGIPLGSVPFRLRFQFDDNLPSIDVSGTVRSLGYNPDMPVLSPIVSTSATDAQFELYPAVFRDLIAHPGWIHTRSFRDDDSPTMGISLLVEPWDPTRPRPVPEPSTSLVFAIALLAGLGFQARRAREQATRPRLWPTSP